MNPFGKRTKVQAAAEAPTRTERFKTPSLLRYIFVNLHKFLDTTTTLHGVKYTVNRSLSIWQRLFFIISFCIVVTAAFTFCIEIFNNWRETPVITLMSSNMTSVMDQPFPAITICNMNRVKRSKVARIKKGTLDYALLQMACFQDFDYAAYANLRLKNDTRTYGDFVLEYGQPCSEMVMFCQFGTKEWDCASLFKAILVDEGLCCVFNILHPSFLFQSDFKKLPDYETTNGHIPVSWSVEAGYPQQLPVHYYPRRALGAGAALGFTVLLNADLDEYYCSNTNSAGFHFVVHNPIDRPFIKETGGAFPIGHETRIIMDPLMFEASPLIRSNAPEQRQCIFDSEHKLHYFRYYSRRNCEMECDALFMMQRCKCLHFYMPRVFSNASLCHIEDFACVYEASKEIDSIKKFDCKDDCLPGCHELFYTTDIFPTPLAEDDFGLRRPIMRNQSKVFMKRNLALVQFFFEHPYYRSYVKAPYTAFTDFLSQTGGVMSLFMGFSFISIAELFYFSIICPLFDYFLKRTDMAPSEPDSAPMPDEHEPQPQKDQNFKQKFFKNATEPHTANWATGFLQRYATHNIGNLRSSSTFTSNLKEFPYLE